MPIIYRSIFFILVFVAVNRVQAQLTPASCVHSGGLGFALDAYLASLGACDCQRTGVLLTQFSKCNTDPLVLDFEDNFDGDTIDLNKWQLSPWTQSDLGAGQSMELRTLNNVSVKDGTCSIIAKKETIISRAVNYLPENEIVEDGKRNLRTYEYTSSMLVSRQKFFHGKYEIRCKMPVGNGLWPAFWTFGGQRYNEIDIFDTYKGTNEIISCIYHDYDGDKKASGCKISTLGFDLSQWHTYSLLFEEDKMIFYIDDKPINIIYRVMSIAREPILCDDNIDYGTYFQLMSYPREPMSIIFNLAVISNNGPGNASPPDDSTPFPSAFEVDYIRFYRRSPELIHAHPNPTNDITTISSKSNISTITVLNTFGRIVHAANINNTSFTLDLSAQPDGIYFLQATLNNTTQTIKIVKFT